ncbi:MAG: class I SAM-dependent methyltransferase [Bacteroidetes bacterium]|nr:class I SAM-dependent methyltransferase [Bacteroidota bacterium]
MNWKEFWNQKSLEGNAQKQVGRVKNGVVMPLQTLSLIAGDIKQKIDLKVNDKLLDVCCGNGLLSAELAKYCKQVTAVDLSEMLINKAKVNHTDSNILFKQADALNLSLDGKFDKIVLYFSFQYFDTYQRGFDVIKNLSKHMKSGATIFIGDVPDLAKKDVYYDSFSKKLRLIKQNVFGQNDMGKFWSEEEMNRICRSLGLKGEFIQQKSELPFSNYRFDYLIKKY